MSTKRQSDSQAYTVYSGTTDAKTVAKDIEADADDLMDEYRKMDGVETLNPSISGDQDHYIAESSTGRVKIIDGSKNTTVYITADASANGYTELTDPLENVDIDLEKLKDRLER